VGDTDKGFICRADLQVCEIRNAGLKPCPTLIRNWLMENKKIVKKIEMR